MALQQLVCCFTVVIIFFCKACDSQQPACGSRVVNSGNITGAHDAAAGYWPWFAHIKVDGGPPLFDSGSGFVPTSFGFGGSLINDQWVLTAASTMSLGFSSVVVYLGRNSLSGPNPNEVNRTVVNITCHPGFSSSTHENDICLLKLSAPVNFTDYIQPTCLASQNSTFNSETGSWAIGFDGFGSSSNLQEVNIPIVGNSVCTDSRPGVTDSIICTGEMDPCLVSLGAPLMTQSGPIWLQSGVLIAVGCFEIPSVYTPVSQYQKWIRDTVTGTPPGFVTYPSPPSSTAPPTTPPSPPTDPSTTPPVPPTTSTTTPAPPTDPSTTPPAPPTTSTTPPVPPTTSTTPPVPSTTPPAPPTDPSTTPPAPPTDPSTTPPVPPTDPSTTPPAPPTDPSTTPPAPPTTFTPPPTSPTCAGVFCSGENLIHFTHFTSLCVLVVLLHVFAATVGN